MAKEKLTQTKCEKLKAKGLYNDGGGLCLQVGEGGGAKSWIYRYAVGGRERHMGLGGFDTFNIEEARELARKCRKLRAQGMDPIEHRKGQRHARAEAERRAAAQNVTFRQEAEAHLAQADWRPGTMAHARRVIPRYLYPMLGDKYVSVIDPTHCAEVLKPIINKGALAAASQVHMFLHSILETASANGHRQGDNPARLTKGPLGKLLPKLVAFRTGKFSKQFPALDYKQAGEFTKALRAFRYQHWEGKTSIPAKALELLLLTGVRTEQITSLRWNEVNWEERLCIWTPDRHKTGGKTGKDYVAPLSDQAMAILEEMRRMQEEHGLYKEDGSVFVHGPSTDVHGRPVSVKVAGRAIHRQSPWMFLRVASGDHGWKDKDGNRVSTMRAEQYQLSVYEPGWRKPSSRPLAVLPWLGDDGDDA